MHSAIKPLLDDLIDVAEAAGWSRRTTASTLMSSLRGTSQDHRRHPQEADREL